MMPIRAVVMGCFSPGIGNLTERRDKLMAIAWLYRFDNSHGSQPSQLPIHDLASTGCATPLNRGLRFYDEGFC
jgi:hypothetical protein